jgi:hypothetical protein
MSCCVTLGLTQKGGDLASSVTNKAIIEATRCAVVAAVARARTNPPCAGCLPRVSGGPGGISESLYLANVVASCPPLRPSQARNLANQQLRGVPSSVRTALIQEKTIREFAPPDDPLRRFVMYQGPIISPPCPPTPTEQLNSTMPKPSNGCFAQIPFYQRPSG